MLYSLRCCTVQLTLSLSTNGTAHMDGRTHRVEMKGIVQPLKRWVMGGINRWDIYSSTFLSNFYIFYAHSDFRQSTVSTRQPRPDNQKKQLLPTDTTDTRQPTPNNRQRIKKYKKILYSKPGWKQNPSTGLLPPHKFSLRQKK